MSLLFRKTEERAISYQDVWGSGERSPVRGDQLETALSVVPVYSATGYIADQFASSPWAAYDTTAGAPVKAATQPSIITDPGVRQLDVFSWKHQLCTSMLLWGNAYGYIGSLDRAGNPAKVEWLRPDRMNLNDGEFYFNGEHVSRSNLIHIPMYVLPGSPVGLSPLGLFRTQIETGIEAQRVGKNFFKRGMVPSALLRNKAKQLDAEQAATVKRRFIASVSSSEPFVTGMDWEYTAIGLPQSDVAFLAGIKATATQVAAIYRISPEIVGGETSGSSLTYKNLEQDQIRFNTVTLRPITSRAEAVIDHYMLRQYVKFNLDAGARADLKTRYEAHQIAIDAGFKTADEIRALEELPPLTDLQRQLMAMKKIQSTVKGTAGA
ncbi:phage portal protein [Cryobacterium fucosi]|uniref:Phage portal protein n=1 Tax=Cryobacterium fucosi TaxID=1259157 RepID=A0A4R9B2S5_9MICO|nr:phage portal protein [Cryobacterium fucosi]TFD74728.1 phage portal protein [Cryobacterium fucosi]